MTKELLAAAFALVAVAMPLKVGWFSGPPLPVGRSEVAVAVVDDAIYVIGGYADGNVDQSLVQVFRPSVSDDYQLSGKWRDAAPLPRGLNHVGAVGYHGKIYTFGGFTTQNNAPVSDANDYDPHTNRWSAIAPLPRALGSVSVAVLGDEIHLVGGRDVHSVGTHWVYDPTANRYSERAPLPVGRDHMGLVAFEGCLFAIGGRIDTPAHNTALVDIYDKAKDRWSSGPPLPEPRSGIAAAAYIKRIFVAGGEQAGMAKAFSTVFAYDLWTHGWSQYGLLPEGRHGTGAAVVGDFLYIPGGAPIPGGRLQSNTLFVYRPAMISAAGRHEPIARGP